MDLLRKSLVLLFALSLFAILGQAGPATILCTEAASGPTAGDGGAGLTMGGCIASIPTSSPHLWLASDGEVPFYPFGVTFDVSDAVRLNASWLPDPAFAAAFGTGLWTDIGNSTWVLPEGGFEPVAKWYFSPGAPWNLGTPDYLIMLESDGTLGDQIWIDNTGPGGSAAITFMSDPIPEPGTVVLFGIGLSSILAARRLLRKRA